MNCLKKYKLDDYIKEQAIKERPIIGICLGMQLLASTSSEHGLNAGLDIIPGNVLPIDKAKSHIGWNQMIFNNNDYLKFNNDFFYFNHSFYFDTKKEYQFATYNFINTYAAIVKKNNIFGLQFHPEKSQIPGRSFFYKIILDVLNA